MYKCRSELCLFVIICDYFMVIDDYFIINGLCLFVIICDYLLLLIILCDHL